MRIFSHWTRIEESVAIGGRTERLHCYGGSDHSLNDAVRDARRRLRNVADRIRDGRRADPDYEADIREEITARVDDQNIVTRNRYGAEVLNSANVVFVDIDEPRLTWREIFFGRDRDLARCKQRIIDQVRRQAEKPELGSLGIRIYETHKGIRLLITGRKFDPKARETGKFLRRLDADHLYTMLCAKQGCFRARLTPKPYRMKLRTHRVVFPRLDGRTEREFQEWLAEYQARREKFATCRYVATLGVPAQGAVIDYHDQATGALSQLKLA